MIKPVQIPINKGSRPDYNIQLGYPRLLNMFVGKSGFVYHTPSLLLLSSIPEIRDFLYIPFNGGYYFVVTNTSVNRVSLSGANSLISPITYSGLDITICFNQNNQVSFSDGRWGYVYDQNDNSFTRLDSIDGFDIKNPISVCQVNNMTVWLGSDGKFQNSFVNNALIYSAIQVAAISGNLTKALALVNLTNNLYIVGTTGIERWAAITSNVYDFPFTKDPNFRAEYGAINSSSVINAIDNVYLLSSKKIPMRLTSQGLFPISDKMDLSGFANIISSYELNGQDLTKTFGSFFSFNGQFFYCMTFLTEGISWVYCENSDTFFESDDLIISAAQNSEVVATKNGLFKLNSISSYKHRQFVSERIVKNINLSPSYNMLNGLEIKFIQGMPQDNNPQLVYLSLSIDSKEWLNSFPLEIGVTGLRNARTVFGCNVAYPHDITFKLDYYGYYPLVLESLEALIK